MASTAASSSSSSAVNGAQHHFSSIDDAVEEIRQGKFVVVLDDEDRENEGDLIIAADKITTEQMAWLIKWSSGFVCISVHPTRIQALNLPMMFPNNQEPHKTAYTVTVDYKHGTTTGISAHDRALTSRKLADFQNAGEHDFTRPGHLCPLRYTEGGVRVRMGHTEASVDLAIAAGLPPVALLCELVDPDSATGAIASRDACLKFAKQHGLKVVSIAALKKWREDREGPLKSQDAIVNGKSMDEIRGIKLDEQKVVGPQSSKT